MLAGIALFGMYGVLIIWATYMAWKHTDGSKKAAIKAWMWQATRRPRVDRS